MGSTASIAAQRNKLHNELVKIGSEGIDVPAYPSRPFPCSLPRPPVRMDQVSSGTTTALPCLAPHLRMRPVWNCCLAAMTAARLSCRSICQCPSIGKGRVSSRLRCDGCIHFSRGHLKGAALRDRQQGCSTWSESILVSNNLFQQDNKPEYSHMKKPGQDVAGLCIRRAARYSL